MDPLEAAIECIGSKGDYEERMGPRSIFIENCWNPGNTA
jgi:hypothetical protein